MRATIGVASHPGRKSKVVDACYTMWVRSHPGGRKGKRSVGVQVGIPNGLYVSAQSGCPFGPNLFSD